MVSPLRISSSHYGNELAPCCPLTWSRLQWLYCSSHRPGTQLFHLWFSLPGKLLSQLSMWLSLISFISYSNVIRVAILTILNWASSIPSGLHHSSAVGGGGWVQRGNTEWHPWYLSTCQMPTASRCPVMTSTVSPVWQTTVPWGTKRHTGKKKTHNQPSLSYTSF